MSTPVLIAVLTIWWCASTLCQISERVKRHLSQYDPLGLLPCWSFFAPNPGTTDYRLVYRDFGNENGADDWLEVPIYHRNCLRCIWNPDKHKAKAFSDLVQMLFRNCETLSENLTGVQLTWPYLAILRQITSLPKAQGVARRQFAVVASSGHIVPRKLTLLFVSAIHQL